MERTPVPTWETIGEETWDRPLRLRFLGGTMHLRRIRPRDDDYDKVIDLRYRGFVESGFIDPRRTGHAAMRLERDEESIILGLFRRRRLHATVTLNTISRRFPGMAMELDKRVVVRHAHFRDPGVLEITKLVVDHGTRGRRPALALLFASSMIARVLGKLHLWQVSRDIPSDVSWRVGLGFDYSVSGPFMDADLNQMPSRVGYLYLPSATVNPRVPGFIRELYRDALSAPLDSEPTEAAGA